MSTSLLLPAVGSQIWVHALTDRQNTATKPGDRPIRLKQSFLGPAAAAAAGVCERLSCRLAQPDQSAAARVGAIPEAPGWIVGPRPCLGADERFFSLSRLPSLSLTGTHSLTHTRVRIAFGASSSQMIGFSCSPSCPPVLCPSFQPQQRALPSLAIAEWEQNEQDGIKVSRRLSCSLFTFFFVFPPSSAARLNAVGLPNVGHCAQTRSYRPLPAAQ